MECKISVKADTGVIYVPTDYPTIQGAINNATPGETIFVKAGIYYEHVAINKSVSLVGEDRDSTIVDGSGTGNVIYIRAENVSIKGFTIRRSGTGPIYCGIVVDSSTGIDISNNKITNNSYGILLSLSSNNVFSGNIISSNNNGINLFSSSNNVFSGNIISSNNYYGMYFTLSSMNNIIRRNNFNNTQQVYFDYPSAANVWDDGDEGNYWSGYTGQDLDGDGIGDTPFFIAEDNQDNHPLMGMFADFKVTLNGETYHVTTICNSTISEFRFEIGTETGNKIIRFNVTGKDITVGFCRVMIPTELMTYPYITMVGAQEIVPTLLDVSNETYTYLYFTYTHSSHTITIISSKTLHLYNELLDKHAKLQIDLYNLNATYYNLLNNYSILLGDYSQLQESYQELNISYQEHLNDYNILLGSYSVLIGDYSQLQESYQELNISYQEHLNDYNILLGSYSVLIGDYSQLQESYQELNISYQEHISHYSENVQNIRNLIYTLAATTAIFIISIIYLSKQAHVGKTKVFVDKK